jgi:hypothetical protein
MWGLELRPPGELMPDVAAQTWVPDFAKIDRRNRVRQWQRAVAAQPQ